MLKIHFSLKQLLLVGVVASLYACGGGGGGSGGDYKSSTPPAQNSSAPNPGEPSSSSAPSNGGGDSSSSSAPSNGGGDSSSSSAPSNGGDSSSSQPPVTTPSSSSSSSTPIAVGNAANGAVLYKQLSCDSCHGADGKLKSSILNNNRSIDVVKNEYNHSTATNENLSLEAYIAKYMPSGKVGSCVGSCADDISAFMRNGFSGVVTIPSSSSSTSVATSSSSSSSAPISSSSSSSSSTPATPSSSSSSSVPVTPPSSSSSSEAPVLPSSSSSSSVPVSSPSSSSSSTPSVSLGGDPANGAALYQSMSCGVCHGNTGGGGIDRAITPVKDSYAHSNGDSGLSLETFISKYMPTDAVCFDDCAKDIAAFMRNGFSGQIASSSSSSSVSNGNNSSSSSSAPWVDPTQPIASCDVTYGPRGLRVLTRNEFSNSIEDLTGINILGDLGATVYASLPADSMVSGFSNNILTNVEPGSLQGYSAAVSRIVEKLAESNFAGVVSCSASEGVESCGMKLIENFLPKVMRRSLTESEMESYLELFTPEYSGGDYKEALKLALRTVFTSPDFLYRDETGVSIVDIENGTSDEPEYEATGTVQLMLFDGQPSKDPGYYAGGNVNFVNGYNMIEIVAKALVGGSGSWPVLNVSTTGFTADISISAAYNKVYRILIPAGKVTGNQHLQFRTNNGNNQIMMESVKVSGAQEKVITAPPVVLDRDAYVLTPHQLATYLAFTFTGSTPDDVLLKAAQEEGLETKAQIEAQVERLLATARARKHFGDHAVQWLRADRILEKPKSDIYYPGFTSAVREAMVQEVRDVFTHVVLEEGEPFRSMYSGDFTFVNGPLAELYGIGGVSGQQMRKVNGLSERGGLMTSGAFMTVNSHDVDNAPILRATYFRRDFMCHYVPPPPTGVSLQGDNIDALREESVRQWEIYLAEQGGKATPRQKYEHQTSAIPCQVCHAKMINPLGGGMEDFNPVGQKTSVHYNGLPVNAVGTLFGMTDALGYDGEVLQFTGARELANAASGYDSTRACFIDNSFRMAVGTGSTYFDRSMSINLTRFEKSNYACEVQKLDSIMKTTNNSTKAMLKALGSLDSVRYRKDVQR